ncbi:hypothetical protein [Amycolatopsis magusensis]|uniref:Repeat domain-containing protein n=1 Tax=Amycolatopsis magusensis TaxID=882444 RepID=A0ABS4PQR3_9PSEU|nr:hypothetical protein [Amycolatopsis magusensis]MBP2181767.1 hypothetical protein [Amycolatopsis magusensis]
MSFVSRAGIVLGTAVIGMAVALPASAADSVTVSADLNGDGVADKVSVRVYDSQRQVLNAEVGGTTLGVLLPLDSHIGVVAPKIVDLSGDGTQDIVVSEVEGANTTTFSAWDLGPAGLRQLTTPDSQPMRLYDGGGLAARNRLTCTDDQGFRELVVVSAEADWNTDPIVYHGTRTSYRVADGVATQGQVVPITAQPGDSPLLQGELAAC